MSSPSLQGSFRPMREHAEAMSPLKPSKSRFSSLLADASNQIRKEQDEKVAVQYQMNEAYQIASEWAQEETDRRLAQELDTQLSEEMKQMKIKDISRGEQAALSLAMEERRRMLAEAQAKREIESKDTEFCKKLAADECDQDQKLTEVCAKDEDFAKSVYDSLQDELLAEEIQRREAEDYKKYCEERDNNLRADAKWAQEHQDMLRREFEAEEDKVISKDYALAKQVQDDLERVEKAQKKKQEILDLRMSHRLQVISSREEHRRKKRIAWMSSASYKPFSDFSLISKQWIDADAEVEDVQDGICMTIVLPHLKNISVRVVGKKIVELKAERMIYAHEPSPTSENSQYLAEFVIDGSNVNITEEDMSYEYDSESGLLHIYVEKVRLQNEQEIKLENEEQAKEKTMLTTIKNTFQRIFGKN